MTRMRERKKRKALLTNRKSAAAQGRMKQISELAADTPVGGRKRRRGGDGELAVSFLQCLSSDSTLLPDNSG
jgi:actin-related protein 5